MLDYIRIACAVPRVQVGEVKKNVENICERILEADAGKADVAVFPELALTGYTCADLFFQETLLRACREGLKEIARCSRECPELTVAVGLPVVLGGQMYNCAAVLQNGICYGLVPKTYLPNYDEFYERRWFSSSEDLQQAEVSPEEVGLSQEGKIPVGRDVLFRLGDGTVMGVEICEDLWTPMPPSTGQR